MTYKLYLDYCSQPCRAIVLFMQQNNLKFDEEIVSFVTGQTRSEAYRKVNPIQKVPALDDDGWILTESVAILKYIATKEKTPDHWYPSELRQRARFDEFVAWQHTTIRRFGSLVFITAGLQPHRTGQTVDEEKLKEYVAEYEKMLNQIENYFLLRGNFLIGDDISIADLLAICEMQQPASVGYDVTRNRPKLTAWINRMKAILGSSFDDVNRAIFEFGAPYKRQFSR